MVLEWAAKEGWNPGVHDGKSFYRADPEGFFVGWLEEEPVGAISAVRYGAGFGFVGLYIVRPEYRGQGYGKRIWDYGVDFLQGRNVGLDGVVEQQANYGKSGFRLAYRNIRFEGKVGEIQKFQQVDTRLKDSSKWVDLWKCDVKEISRYDRQFFPESRQEFLAEWVTQDGSVGVGVRQNEKWLGLGVIRRCREGYKIGPLYGENKQIAQEILYKLVEKLHPAEPVYLDIPEPNPFARELVQELGMQPVFETARMYNKETPQVDLSKLFGVCTFELG